MLRRKVEELESEGDTLKKRVKELQEKLSSTKVASTKKTTTKSEPVSSSAVYDQKMKVKDPMLKGYT